MKKLKFYPNELWKTIAAVVILFGTTLPSIAQVSVWQFRQVDQANMEEFIQRETKYWSKVAESAVEKGNLTFWGLFVKQGGFDIPKTPNVIFINTFNDIDAADMAAIWDPSALFPDVPIEEIETGSISKTLHMVFASPGNWVQKEGSNPEEDFNFIRFIFHNTDSPADLIALEDEHWAPFIKSAIEDGKTSQLAWGNATILAPSGPNMDATTISYDIYPTLTSALTGGFGDDENIVFPEEGLAKINELETSRRYNNVYSIVQVVSGN